MLLVKFAKIRYTRQIVVSYSTHLPWRPSVLSCLLCHFLDCLTTVLNGLDWSAVQKMNF